MIIIYVESIDETSRLIDINKFSYANKRSILFYTYFQMK